MQYRPPNTYQDVSNTNVTGDSDSLLFTPFLTVQVDSRLPVNAWLVQYSTSSVALKHSQHGVSCEDYVGEEDGVEVDVRPSEVQQPGNLV